MKTVFSAIKLTFNYKSEKQLAQTNNNVAKVHAVRNKFRVAWYKTTNRDI